MKSLRKISFYCCPLFYLSNPSTLARVLLNLEVLHLCDEVACVSLSQPRVLDHKQELDTLQTCQTRPSFEDEGSVKAVVSVRYEENTAFLVEEWTDSATMVDLSWSVGSRVEYSCYGD